jgi:hypothetical protein
MKPNQSQISDSTKEGNLTVMREMMIPNDLKNFPHLALQ